EHPVARVVRPDKVTFAAVAATLAAWKTGRWREVPIHRAAAASSDSLTAGAERIRAGAHGGGDGKVAIEIVPALAVFGGGTSPEKTFPSRALAIVGPGMAADELTAPLHARKPPR